VRGLERNEESMQLTGERKKEKETGREKEEIVRLRRGIPGKV
jgi:hypothetical protein